MDRKHPTWEHRSSWNAHWQEYHAGRSASGSSQGESRHAKDAAGWPHTQVLKHISSLIDLAGARSLEVGSGRGINSICLAKLGAEAYVLDYSDRAIALTHKCAAREKVKMGSACADALHIPLPDGTFDLVFSIGLQGVRHEPSKL